MPSALPISLRCFCIWIPWSWNRFMYRIVWLRSFTRIRILASCCLRYAGRKLIQTPIRSVMHFLDIDTMAERLQGKTFLGCEVQDCYGAWFSVILIPQKKDEQGRALAVLIATRDISEVKKTEEMTFKDQLTGLYNRNYMEARREHFVRTGDFPVSLLMIDCNYLKRTNDTLGHEYGDLLLQRIANIILESIDTSCVAMRVGGDEFLVLCTHCDREKVQKMIDAMKKKMVERSDEKLHLSAAFGASTVEGEPFDFDRTYKAADAAMYVDKKASRAER
ncbi:MAG TPA: hypothetical protein DD632_01085 [Oribacterium sp.]|nr:hypothetical protein [Oribacterium sp.]